MPMSGFAPEWANVRDVQRHPVRLGAVAVVSEDRGPTPLLHEQVAWVFIYHNTRIVAVALSKGECEDHMGMHVVISAQDADCQARMLLKQPLYRLRQDGNGGIDDFELSTVHVQLVLVLRGFRSVVVCMECVAAEDKDCFLAGGYQGKHLGEGVPHVSAGEAQVIILTPDLVAPCPHPQVQIHQGIDRAQILVHGLWRSNRLGGLHSLESFTNARQNVFCGFLLLSDVDRTRDAVFVLAGFDPHTGGGDAGSNRIHSSLNGGVGSPQAARLGLPDSALKCLAGNAHCSCRWTNTLELLYCQNRFAQLFITDGLSWHQAPRARSTR